VTELVETRAIGTGLRRLDGPAKVTGTARYAYERPVANPLYCIRCNPPSPAVGSPR
jgi:CO/xanthine dehydrogenase Mo-binding subunit